MSKPQIVIVGAGPAGMVLAYQLVTNGVPVRVLEQHPDLEREFRGELLGPSVLPALDSLGILPMLTERGFARPGVERRMFVGAKRRVTLPGGAELGAQISQPGLLALLHELCSRHPHYQLDFKTTALSAVREGERVTALVVRREGREERVEGDVFVVCNGRNSRLRKDLGLDVELSEKPDSTLWLRFDFADAPEALPRTVDVHMFGKGVVVVHFATAGKPRLQIAYSAPGDVGALRKDLPALRERLLPTLPEGLRELVAARIDDRMESQVLAVAIDRLKTWHVPGMLFLGDAAHTMSPAGGQGLNLAIRDSIVAANHMIDAVRAGTPIDAPVFARIEGERRPEIEAAQAGQLRAHRMVHKPLFVEHMMFTMLGVVMRFKTFAIPPPPPVEPRHAVRATPQ
ncbi:FAD-dependent monooxygenase [Polyangium aurulentum]|uniref:FAD-dependent monooxygenase n=1 Tax=Polyangium aurulentum TaxID=2567896 RepID=UPI0010AE06EA|nr:FAD-dependent monooxygenase [Polyangium aurulentum]UQA60869.1 FAD-dependent monooxygenase [Polyangium aurulentum]